MTQASDADLVAVTLAGDAAAFAVLVERHQRRLYHALRRLIGDDGTAEEAVQDGFVRAWERLDRFDPDRPFFPWLARISVNLWLNRLRAERREHPFADEVADDADGDDAAPPLADDAPLPEAQAEAADVRWRVWRAVDRLAPEARRIVVLRHSLELSYDEICAVTGLPMGTVKSRLSRARHELAAALGDLADGA